MRGDTDMGQAYVTIYDRTGERCYAFYNVRASEENNALSGYTLCGGENDPFEYLKLEIPRKKMFQIAPDLMEPNAIVSGVNRVYLNAMGRGSYITAASNLTGETCTITAYCQAYKLTSTVLADSLTGRPFDIIEDIVKGGRFGDFITGDLKYWCVKREDVADLLSFNSGETLWYVIQVCAMYLGCRVFFTGEDCYLVDYRLALPVDPDVSSDHGQITFTRQGEQYVGSTTAMTGFRCSGELLRNDDGTTTANRCIPNAVYDFDDIDLFSTDAARPEYGRVVGEVRLGNEGLTTVINKITINCANNVAVTIQSNKAVRQYDNTEMSKIIDIPSLIETNPENYDTDEKIYHQGLTVASNIIDYRCESQQSMEFTFKEFVHTNGEIHWVPFFPPSSRVKSISDSVDNVNVSNISTLNNSIVKPQKLILSSYTRTFPEGTSTYKFGVISSVDLSTKLSEMTTAQNT